MLPLEITRVRDRAHVITGGIALAGVLTRAKGRKSAYLSAGPTQGPCRLDIVVEAMGRVNYGPFMGDERKGITESVTLAGGLVTNWTISAVGLQTLPLGLTFSVPSYTSESPSKGNSLAMDKGSLSSRQDFLPTFFQGSITVIGAPQDTFLSTRCVQKWRSCLPWVVYLHNLTGFIVGVIFVLHQGVQGSGVLLISTVARFN